MKALSHIVFFGSDAICLPVLNYLHSEASEWCHLRAVVSQPDRRQGRGKKQQANPVAAWATQHSVELLQPPKPDAALAEWLIREKVIASLVMAYGHYLPRAVRDAAPNGMVNLHGSILPDYRGAAPVETALAQGDTETGVCLMEIAEKMDAGGVADTEKVRIDSMDTSVSLRAKIGEASVPLLRRNLSKLMAGPLDFVPQDDAQATFCRKITKQDGAIDFFLSATQIDCRLRALTPWPGNFFEHGGARIKVGTAKPLQIDVSESPGTVLDCTEGVTVATARGAICFHELQRPGGRMLPASDFLNGYTLPVGAVLSSTPSMPLQVNGSD
jgi:methionyl-tRNA formyltransferase